MRTINGILELDYETVGNVLSITIREKGSLEWDWLKRIWRNIRDKNIDYPTTWYNITSKLWKTHNNSKVLVDLYPTGAGNIRGLIEDELKKLEGENINSKVFQKNYLGSQNNYQFIFSVESDEYLKKIFEIYYAHYEMFIYIIDKKRVKKFANLISKYGRSFSEEYLIKKEQNPFSYITTNIDMHILTNFFSVNDIIQAIEYSMKVMPDK